MYIHCGTEYSTVEPVMYIHTLLYWLQYSWTSYVCTLCSISTVHLNQLCMYIMQYWVQYGWTIYVSTYTRTSYVCTICSCSTEYSSLEPVMYIVHCAVSSTVRLNQLCTFCTVQYRVQFTWTSYVHWTLCSTEYSSLEPVI